MKFKDALIAYLNAKSDAERLKLEAALKRLGKWQVLPPMSILKKTAELYINRSPPL